MATPCRATSRHLLAAPLTPPPCRASDATSLPAQAQTSTTKTKDRPTLRLEPGIPMADDMTISSWVHFPLPLSPFLYKPDGGSALRKRRHRWTTLYCDSEDEFNHVCILQFEDNMDYRHVSGGQGTRTGAQFGINDNTGGVGFEFEAFEADDGEPQRQISGLSHGWHLVTLVTGPHQDKLFVDGTVRCCAPCAQPSVLPSRLLLRCTALGQGAEAHCRALSDHGHRRHPAAADQMPPAELQRHRCHHRLPPGEHGGAGPRRLPPGTRASADPALGGARVQVPARAAWHCRSLLVPSAPLASSHRAPPPHFRFQDALFPIVSS